MAKEETKTAEAVQSSVSSIYSSLLNKRKEQIEAKEERKRLEKEKEEAEKELNETKSDGTKKSKKEIREEEMKHWNEILVGLTGDDLEYSSKKSKKKRFKKWIDDELTNANINAKPKKAKKKNYNKEFASELNMLKNLVAEQNKFTQTLQKRYDIMAGPNTKDAMPLNKTQVDLASAINASRANSLGVLREIGGIKKSIADLTMKQKKLDADLGSSGDISSGDIGLMGSSIASSLFGDSGLYNNSSSSTNGISGNGGINPGTYEPQVKNIVQTPQMEEAYRNGEILGSNNYDEAESSFDPSTWDGGPSLDPNSSVMFENIPHHVVVEYHENEGTARFKAVRNDDGTELEGCPVPTTDPKKLTFNTKDKIVKGEFDETYKLEIV
jgi:hypothetical protein